MRLVVLPGVFAPISDTRLLSESLRAHVVPGRSTVLDLCTGSGAIAIHAAKAGARTVCAGDIAWRSVLNARLNARLGRVQIDVRRGDLLAPFANRRFDLIATNPPYVPSRSEQLPSRGRARAWDAGPNGRALIDRICAEAPTHLTPGGALLLIHSSWCDSEMTLQRLREAGLTAAVFRRVRGPLGPLMSARAAEIAVLGSAQAGAHEEELLVMRGVAQMGRSAARHLVNVPARSPIDAPGQARQG